MPKFETSDGVKLFYESVGEGEPLILVHPPLMGHVVFKYQKNLAENYRLIFLDLRGHGHSDRHVLDVSMSRLVEDLHELVEHLNIQKTALLGYSAGGAICQAFASHYPDRVSAMILSGGFMKVESLLLDLEFKLGMAMMKWKRRSFLSKVLAKSHANSPHDQQEMFDYGKKIDPGVVAAIYRECLAYDGTKEAWHLNDIPILLIYGSRSYLKKHARSFLKELPNTRLAYIEQAKHQLPTRAFEPFNNLVSRFLRMNSENRMALQ